MLTKRKFSLEYDIHQDFVIDAPFHEGALRCLLYLFEKQKELNFIFFIKFELEEKHRINKEYYEKLLQFHCPWLRDDIFGVWLVMTDVEGLIRNHLFHYLPIYYEVKLKLATPGGESKATFSSDGSIKLGGRVIEVTKNTKEYYFCKEMFGRDVGVFYSWDEIADTMGSIDKKLQITGEGNDRMMSKRIQSYISAINKKFTSNGFPSIFEMVGKEVRRLY